MINDMLYYFGLIFSSGWAEPYYMLLKVSVIGAIAAISDIIV